MIPLISHDTSLLDNEAFEDKGIRGYSEEKRGSGE